jgi:hypothetical protein
VVASAQLPETCTHNESKQEVRGKLAAKNGATVLEHRCLESRAATEGWPGCWGPCTGCHTQHGSGRQHPAACNVTQNRSTEHQASDGCSPAPSCLCLQQDTA